VEKGRKGERENGERENGEREKGMSCPEISLLN